MKPISLLCSGILAVSSLLSSESSPVVGFWGDGTGIHPTSNPPTVWNGETGLNILWHTPTPTFGYAAPTVLQDRVVYLTEVDAEHPFPLLVGLDLATGAECWRTVINPLAIAIPEEGKRKEIEDLWKATIRWRADFNLLLRDWKAAPAEGKGALAQRMSALGLKPDCAMGGKGFPSDTDAANLTLLGAPWTKPWGALGKVGLVGDTWRFHCYGIPGGGWYFGEAFATPISDGKRVYVQLAWGTWAAFDRDGKQLWMQHQPSLAGGDYCQAGRSPLIWKERLITDLGDWVRAFDTATGRQIWAVSRKEKKISQHEMESPVVVTVAGKDYLFCNSYPPITIRLEDGVVCPIAGIKSPGLIARGNPDQRDMLFMSGGGEHGGWENKGNADIKPPAAVRLSPGEGDALKAEVLWHGVNGAQYGSQVTPMICSKNRLYFGDLILDALTGKVLIGRPRARNTPDQAVPGSTLTLAIAGGRIYGQGYSEHGSEKRKDDLGALVESEVYDLDGHRLAVNHLRGLPGQEAMRTRNNIPNWFNYPNNFTIIGDRILTRSCNEVICIGNTAKPFDEAERSKIAPKLVGKAELDVVLSHLDSPDRPVRLAAIQSLGILGNAAASACPKLLTMMQSDQTAKAETGFLALCALGPEAKSIVPDLVKLSVGTVPGKDAMWGKDGTQPLSGTQPCIERARTILAGMGSVAVEAILPLLNDEAGFSAAMQIAAMMPDYDAAVQIFAKGMIEGKAPRFIPRLPPYVRYQELTRQHALPEAINSRAWKTKTAAQILMKALPADPKSREEKERFATCLPIIATADPALLVPRLESLRAMIKERGNNGVIDVLGRMGPLAAPAIADLEAKKTETGLDPKVVAQIDEVLARIRAK